MAKQTVNINNQPNWFLIGVFCTVVAVVFFQPFLAPIALAAVFASLFFPLYRRLSKHINNKIAAGLTMGTSILVVLIPIIFMLILALQQAFSLASTLSNIEYEPGAPLYETVQSIGQSVGTVLPPEAVESTQKTIKEFVTETLPYVITQLVKTLGAIVAAAPQLITSAIIYGFMFNIFLLYRKDIFDFFIAASPFSEKESGRYLQRASLIITASLKGQFIIAFTTGVTSALLLFLLDMQQYFLPMTILLTILGMVPLGGGIVMIPIALFAMASGNFWPGLWVFLIYTCVICNFDNFMRPRLIPKDAGMLQALAVVATFSGLYYFGIMGIVYGPLIVILLMTTAQIYLDHKQQAE